ncbi:hypothetical protein ACJ2A9_15080 [Anaerobacillus sp. MEB173]|uniref:hypothetical protein n=1 Tax=Anaerobacillus sp. MEB173 TaxID=3383345 RepID=UPI003F939FF7
MLTPTNIQTNKLMGMLWENWENSLQKVYDTQQEMGKTSLEAFKKQQDLFTSMTGSLFKVEGEIKNTLDKFTQSVNANIKDISNEEVAGMFDNWNAKMSDILERMQQISVTPSKAWLAMVEKSQERMYESAKKVVKEQNNIQAETKDMIINFMSQVKTSQYDLVQMMEEQTKKTWENFEPK